MAGHNSANPPQPCVRSSRSESKPEKKPKKQLSRWAQERLRHLQDTIGTKDLDRLRAALVTMLPSLSVEPPARLEDAEDFGKWEQALSEVALVGSANPFAITPFLSRHGKVDQDQDEGEDERLPDWLPVDAEAARDPKKDAQQGNAREPFLADRDELSRRQKEADAKEQLPKWMSIDADAPVAEPEADRKPDWMPIEADVDRGDQDAPFLDKKTDGDKRAVASLARTEDAATEIKGLEGKDVEAKTGDQLEAEKAEA